MDRETLRALQAPLKEQYKTSPENAQVTLRAQGKLGHDVTCHVETAYTPVTTGLHPATGGTGRDTCSGDMLLQALVGCAGVTLSAVATALAIPIRGATLTVEGDLDFRGTLGVAKDAPVGFSRIRLRIVLDTDAPLEQQRKLVELTERYYVVYQTLIHNPAISVEFSALAAG